MIIRLCAALAGTALLACAGTQRTRLEQAQLALAREFVHRRDWSGAFGAADGLCRALPRDAEALALRGIVYREQRLHREAEADLLEALRLAPDLAEAHSALAILYDVQGKAQDAIQHHRRAAEREPRNAAYLNNLGFSLLVHGRAREAVSSLEEALRNAPMDARIRNNLGFALAATGDFTRASEQFALAGSTVDARNNLGWAYERRGGLAQAFDMYAEAIRSDPTASAPRQNLERVARALGRAPPADLPAAPGGE